MKTTAKKTDGQKAKGIIEGIRFDSMRSHILATMRATSMLDSLLSETTDDCTAEEYRELIHYSREVRDACEQLSRRADNLTNQRFGLVTGCDLD